jgi:hypothetical protein
MLALQLQDACMLSQLWFTADFSNEKVFASCVGHPSLTQLMRAVVRAGAA